MRALLTADQRQFADTVDRFVQREYMVGPAAPRPHFDAERHRRLGTLGCLSLAIPEEHGGFGGGVERMLVAERLAPALAHEPFLACGVRAAAVIARAADRERAQRWLSAIAAGEAIVVMADGFTAQRVAAGWRLTGKARLVLGALQADAFVAGASDDTGGRHLFLVPRTHPGLVVTPRPRLDALPAGDVALDAATFGEDQRLGCGASAGDALAHAEALTEAVEIAESIGLMDACLKATLDHLRTRRQFGAAIGSFQALQHRVADMAIALEEARSLAFAAALACDAESGRNRAIAIAKVRATDAARLVGAEAIQMHGAIGMTDDLAVSHWYRRLLALSQSSGLRHEHIARLAMVTPLH